MSSGSPFKKFKADNSGYAGFINMRNMKRNKAYRIYKIEPSNHTEWGPGELAYVNTNTQVKWRVQFPKKYLKTVQAGTIDRMKAQIAINKFPYLVFRDVLEDNSYKLDVIEDCDEIRKFHMSWKDVPAVEEEVEDEPDVAAPNGVAQPNANGDAQPGANGPQPPVNNAAQQIEDAKAQGSK